MENDASTLTCPTCYGTDFRESRPRKEDSKLALLFKVPVRCTYCRNRMLVPRAQAKQLRPSTAGEDQPS